jgi:hypothetical protein
MLIEHPEQSALPTYTDANVHRVALTGLLSLIAPSKLFQRNDSFKKNNAGYAEQTCVVKGTHGPRHLDRCGGETLGVLFLRLGASRGKVVEVK